MNDSGTGGNLGQADSQSDAFAGTADDSGTDEGPAAADTSSAIDASSVSRDDAGAAVDAGSTADGGCSGEGCSIPIKHVVVIVKENHTFDNYFGSFPGAEGTLTSAGQNLCTTPQGQGPCTQSPDAPAHDICHGHTCALVDWDNGKMDGWSQSGGSDTGDYMAYTQYGERGVPNYWAYARHFVLGDHFFAGMLGPSLPGHMFTVAAQAGWATGNPPSSVLHPYWGCDEPSGDRVPILAGGTTPSTVFPCFNIPSIPDVLPGGVGWRFYGTNFDGLFSEIWSPFNAIQSIRNNPTNWAHVVNVSQFTSDIQNHTLPNVTWLVDQDQFSEHPHVSIPGVPIAIAGVCAGENWTVSYVNQLMQSSFWSDTAIIFTMDDFGGWYDHVPPPRQYGGTAAAPYGLGFRLPVLIMSPYARPGFIFKEVSDHASIARFIERVFGASTTLHDIDPSAQDGLANDLFGAFDFAQQPLAPLVLTARSCP
jgi:phospholipase C